MHRGSDTAIYSAYEDHSPIDSAVSEKNLMRAILRLAMEDLRKSGEVFRDAKRYVLSNDDHYVYSFLCICYHLNICPTTLRSRLGVTAERSASDIAAAAA